MSRDFSFTRTTLIIIQKNLEPDKPKTLFSVDIRAN